MSDFASRSFDLAAAREALRSARRVAVLTGAGVSAESGIPTFRDAQTGLWARFRPDDLASPSAYARDPLFVWSWYKERYEVCAKASPNEGHVRLAEMERDNAGGVTVVTQNVDGLHVRAGSRNVVEVHGNLTTSRCERCGNVDPLPPPDAFDLPPHCSKCGSRARPNVVWFGETLPELALERAYLAFEEASVALVIGTSSVVYPAAALPEVTLHRGGVLIEINPEETPLSRKAHLSLRATASEGLRALTAEPRTNG
ncbi:SIR2 family NAD-dependent protein deacylase [Deinococcus yavapaiensis]|uniref:NAD-dependent protein deacylase n=1 Tax=Deinococcus yavapaiensis KR-236 TaxID=694435 RepID=A0A318SJ84_9DEIO|nr:NAD-dependent deacylase [Deinococcus yavapaiensis]PYE54245.1 NAD-dependent deacetylase [Deinococcus yavapaiensis KR-236]